MLFSTDFSPLHFHCMSVKGAGKQPSFWRWEHFFLQWSLSDLSRVAVWKSAHFLTVRVRARAQTFNCVTSQTVKNCSDYRKYNKSTYVFFFFLLIHMHNSKFEKKTKESILKKLQKYLTLGGAVCLIAR